MFTKIQSKFPKILRIPFRRFEANTRVLHSTSGPVKTLRDLWYESKYGSEPIDILSYDWNKKEFKKNRGLVIAKGKNTVEELIFTCGGTMLVNSNYKFYLKSGECISNDKLYPKDELFTVHNHSSGLHTECTRILTSHSYRVEDTFEILTQPELSNYIVMISDTTGILVKANPTGLLSRYRPRQITRPYGLVVGSGV